MCPHIHSLLNRCTSKQGNPRVNGRSPENVQTLRYNDVKKIRVINYSWYSEDEIQVNATSIVSGLFIHLTLFTYFFFRERDSVMVFKKLEYNCNIYVQICMIFLGLNSGELDSESSHSLCRQSFRPSFIQDQTTNARIN